MNHLIIVYRKQFTVKLGYENEWTRHTISQGLTLAELWIYQGK